MRHYSTSFQALRVSLFAAAGLGLGGCESAFVVADAASSSGTGGGTGGAATGTASSSSAGASSSSATASSSSATAGGGTTATAGSGGAGGMTTSATTGGSGGAGGIGGSGGTGGGTAASSGSGGSDGGLCAGAQKILDANGAYTGFAKCPDGTIHRLEAIACDPTIGTPQCTGMETETSCANDADCTDAPNGTCASYWTSDFGGPKSVCGCAYPCATDAQCAGGGSCVCAGVVTSGTAWASCGEAHCKTGADCATGECGVTSYYDGCWYSVVSSCRTTSDACRTDSDCSAGLTQCVASPGNGDWTCLGNNCAIGRPLLVDGRARTAVSALRGDWAAPSAIDASGLDPALRHALAAHWLEVAALEHASVASFARFSLQLLALGAPAALLLEAQRAGLDEIEHARLAYMLAGAYAGDDVGPAALALDGMTLATDRRDVLRALIVEGCVGETLGAAEATALADEVVNPFLRDTHARIAADEQRHAELAWRTLAWMLERADDATVAFAARCFEDAALAYRAPSAEPIVVAPAHGLLSACAIATLRARVLREVVEPCAAALLRRVETARAARGPTGFQATA